jgi:hypothetical protein
MIKVGVKIFKIFIYLRMKSAELALERSRHAAEVESVRQQLEEALRAAEEHHQTAVRQLQDRDQAWQAEKQVDPLVEIILKF